MARHTPRDDASFGVSLARTLGGGAALIALVAGLFWGLGHLAGPQPAPEVAGATDEGGDAEAPSEPTGSEEPPDAAGEADGGAEAEQPEEPEEPEEVQEPTPPEEAEEAEEAGGAQQPADSDEAEEAQEADDAAFPPGEVRVQVLDGVGSDGGTAAARTAEALREAGYRVVAENPALAYERTTVLWSPGNEEKARQVAAEIGAAEVREQPGNLSDDVDVHVVVGADRA